MSVLNETAPSPVASKSTVPLGVMTCAGIAVSAVAFFLSLNGGSWYGFGVGAVFGWIGICVAVSVCVTVLVLVKKRKNLYSVGARVVWSLLSIVPILLMVLWFWLVATSLPLLAFVLIFLGAYR